MDDDRITADRTPEMADLALLLAESDREDPILAQPRSRGEAQPAPDALDPQILAGLVAP